MKIKIFEEVKEKKYEAITNTEVNGDDSKFLGKPYLKETQEHVSYNKIIEFDGEMAYNSGQWIYQKREINISENETVSINREIFRADLNEYHVFVNKVKYVENKNLKQNQENLVNDLQKVYNKTMIEHDERLVSYCRLHNLKPQYTDCEELFKLIYGGFPTVKDGKLVENSKTDEIGISYISPDYTYMSSNYIKSTRIEQSFL